MTFPLLQYAGVATVIYSLMVSDPEERGAVAAFVVKPACVVAITVRASPPTIVCQRPTGMPYY